MSEKQVDALVQVTATFWEPGMTMVLEELEADHCWGSKWSATFEDFTELDEELSCDEQEVLRFTTPTVCLHFVPIGVSTEMDESSAVQYSIYEVGVHDTFREDYHGLVDIAREKLKQTKATHKCGQPRKRRTAGAPPAKVELVRFIAVYGCWSSRSYEGEYDWGLELRGVLDLNHIHYEGEDNGAERTRREESRRRQERGLAPRRRIAL